MAHVLRLHKETALKQANSLTTAVNIFASPNEAFASIKARPTFFVPMLVACIGVAAYSWLYALEVDLGWLTERQLRGQTLFELTDAQIQAQVNAAVERGRTSTIVTGVLGSFLAITIIYLLQASYLKIVSLITKDGVRYRQWLSLVSWTSLPTVLGSLATIVFILTNDVSYVDQAGVNPLSFASLLQMDLENSSTFVSFASNTSPINIWSLVLLVLGYRFLSESGTFKALAAVLAPVAVIAALLYIVS